MSAIDPINDVVISNATGSDPSALPQNHTEAAPDQVAPVGAPIALAPKASAVKVKIPSLVDACGWHTFNALAAAGILFFVAWANLTDLPNQVESQPGQAHFGAAAGEQNVDAQVTGDVVEVRVKNGDVVVAGDVLAVINQSDSESDVQQAKSKIDGLNANLVRLIAEQNGVAPNFPDPLRADAPFEVRMQDRQYQADMDNARATGAKYRATLDRLTRTLEGLKAQRIRVVATLSTAENIAAKYSSVSSASRTDIQALDAQKPINDAREKLAALDKDIGSTESSFAEQNAFEAKDVADRQSKIADEIKAALTELRPLQGKLEQLQHGITKTVIRAPVDGRISKRIVNVGSGVTPSSHAFEITPNAAELTIQANFRDKDIDALHKALHRDGQAKIDVGGYDHLKWGRLTGTVVTVCSAAVEDKTKQQGGGWSCPVEIKVTSPVTNLGKQLALRSGMTATVHVHGDSRTVWDYLTADFRATADRFGTERGS